jgi:hypothetical protein
MASHFLHHKTSWSLRFPPSVNLVISGVLTNNVNGVWFLDYVLLRKTSEWSRKFDNGYTFQFTFINISVISWPWG